MKNKRMRKIVEEGGYALWEYRPSLFAPLYGNMDRPSFVRRVRLMQEYLSKGKYKACYLQVDGKFVGYNVFAPGGRRLKCSTTRDLVSGPSYVLPEYRGNGYAVKMLVMGIKYFSENYDNVYAWISKNNVASIRAYTKAGFDVDFGELNIVGKCRKLKQVEKGKGTNVIVRYKIN